MKLIYNNIAWIKSLILKKQILNRKILFYFDLVSCIDVNHSKKRHDAIFIENIEDKTIQKMLKVCANQCFPFKEKCNRSLGLPIMHKYFIFLPIIYEILNYKSKPSRQNTLGAIKCHLYPTGGAHERDHSRVNQIFCPVLIFCKEALTGGTKEFEISLHTKDPIFHMNWLRSVLDSKLRYLGGLIRIAHSLFPSSTANYNIKLCNTLTHRVKVIIKLYAEWRTEWKKRERCSFEKKIYIIYIAISQIYISRVKGDVRTGMNRTKQTKSKQTLTS